jgi:hypothetical protein
MIYRALFLADIADNHERQASTADGPKIFGRRESVTGLNYKSLSHRIGA